MQSTAVSKRGPNVAHNRAPTAQTLALAIRIACGGLAYSAAMALPALWSMPASAQSATETQASVAFSIPAGSLSDTLNRFAEQTGLYLSGAGELTRGKNSAGLQGNFTSEKGLRRLLQGTGIIYRFTGANTVSLMSASESGGVMTLPAVMVSAEGERSGSAAGITEWSGSYKASQTNTATKLNLSPRETPQTVTVVTRQQMDDSAMTSVDDALRATSGVFVHDRGQNGNNYYSRGFELQHQYDGMPNPVGISSWNQNPQIDNAFLDRVEVLQGASGLMSGAGDPGGTVNLVRKRPTHEFQAQAEAQLGSWKQRRLVGDISGPLIESGHVRGRLVLLMDEQDSFVDHVFRDRQAVYGIVEADITPNTLVYASLQYQEDKSRNHFGVPFAADGSQAGLSRSAFFGNANNLTTRDYSLYTLGLEQQLPADWMMKLQYSGSKTNYAINNYSFIRGDLDPSTGDGMDIRQQSRVSGDIPYDALDAYISGPVSLLGRSHELVFGANGSTMTRNYAGSGYMAALQPINVYTFDPTALPTAVGANPYTGGYEITQRGCMGWVALA
ncbi:TonB-dependent siderophore receptor [Nitrincola sp. A-D6]|uniref:TonB-dependent siderophore receptor n=1 Tax=Nitrincola sp. A-D6 TaxID=1545442 RepID=UPI00068DE5EC|nr:TonB-dependent receptor plug domain-containing protein [Nitrincola sp. A-D6]